MTLLERLVVHFWGYLLYCIVGGLLGGDLVAWGDRYLWHLPYWGSIGLVVLFSALWCAFATWVRAGAKQKKAQ